MKSLLGFKAKGRDVIEGGKGYNLRKEAAPYMAHFRAERADIGPENAYFGDVNTAKSTRYCGPTPFEKRQMRTLTAEVTLKALGDGTETDEK